MSRYQEALRWLYGLESRGIKLGLQRMKRACAQRGRPERALYCVHVAGSNGKGSVSAMLERVLRTAGYKTGQFCSPHLQRYVERIQIGGRPISESEAATRIFDLRSDARLSDLSFFEYTTLAGFEAFRDAACDVVIVEVGLGGRLDSTNVIRPKLGLITNISLEHQRVLGRSYAKIATEKAGIIKTGTPMVVGETDPRATRAIAEIARTKRASVWWRGEDFNGSWRGDRLDVEVRGERMGGLRLGLAGRHQAENASCAVAALYRLKALGLDLSETDIRSGLRLTRWAGRLELHRGEPSFLFDAAHNVGGAAFLAEYLRGIEKRGRRVLLFGAMKDKDHAAMLRVLGPEVDRVVYTAPTVSRAADPRALATVHPGVIRKTVVSAVARARSLAGPKGMVVVAGSIFLLSEVRALVMGVRNDPQIAM